MKKLLLLALLCTTLTNNASSTVVSPHEAPAGIIIVDTGVGLATVDVYMNAVSVLVQVLDVNGNVQSYTTASPGATVEFTYNSSSRKVRSIYQMTTGTSYIIDDVIMI